MTQAEEIAYWHGFDDGDSRDGIMGSKCRYKDPGLREAYHIGFSDGRKEHTGKVWTFPEKLGSIVEPDLSVVTTPKPPWED